jgi:carbonic anhydrase
MTRFSAILSLIMLFSASFSFSQHKANVPLNKQIKNDNSEMSDNNANNSNSDIIKELLKSNKNFINNSNKKQDFSDQRELTSTKGQHPNLIVVTCSDSRVTPEFIFDKGIGEVFVIRTAGNVIDSVCLGSIEYAAEHLHSSVLLVLGHSSCGAVTAACEGETESPYINSIIKSIKPAVKIAKSKRLDKAQTIDAAIYENVKKQIKSTEKSKIIRELTEDGHLQILGAIYNIKTGSVEFIEE